MSHFTQKLEDAQKSLDTARGNVAELMGMAEAEERDLSDEESLQLEAYAGEITTTEKRITDLERAEKAMADRVVEQQAPNVIKQRGHQERKPGELHIKHATASYISHLESKSIEQVIKERWPNDLGLQAVTKSSIDPADTSTTGWAVELTEEANRGFLELLRGASIAAQMWPSAGVNLQFDGYTAINVPSREGTTTDLASGWTPELGALPVRKAVFATQRIEPYKWGAIVTLSREITQRSTPAIMQIVQSGLVTDTATRLDNDYYGEGAAVAGFRPAGIFAGVTGTASATGGATVGDDMLTDLRNLVDPIYAANMGQMLYLAMHPSNALSMSTVLYNGTYLFRDELARGTLLGLPVITSTNAPLDELWALDMAQQAVASGAMNFETSTSATIVEIDDDGVAPFMGAANPRVPSGQVGGDTAQVPPQTVRSLFQTDAVAIRLIQDLSWANLRTGSVNRITGVSY
jgi:HK97 family phage major capsid protein